MANSSPQPMARCTRCFGLTAHHALWTRMEAEEDPYGGVVFSELLEVVACAGCGETKLQRTYDWHDAGERDVAQFPAPARRRRPGWFLHSNFWIRGAFIYDVLDEIYGALDNGFRRLVAAGVRSLIELIMIEEGGDQGTLRKNLARLEAAGHVTRLQADRLYQVMEVGSAAIHRGHVPAENELDVMLDIAEHLVESIYIHGVQVTRLAENTPPRAPRAKPPAKPGASPPEGGDAA